MIKIWCCKLYSCCSIAQIHSGDSQHGPTLRHILSIHQNNSYVKHRGKYLLNIDSPENQVHN